MKTDPLKDYKIKRKVEEAQNLQLSSQFAPAQKIYEEILEENAGAIDALRGMGILFLQQARVEEGAQWLRRALALAPEDARLWNDLGEALRIQGFFAEATEAYEKALTLKPDFFQAMNNLGAAFMQAGDYAQSERRLRDALGTDPENPFIHNTLGVLLEHQGLLEEALREYESAVKFRPDFQEAHDNYSDLLQRHPEMIGLSVNRLIGDLGGGREIS